MISPSSKPPGLRLRLECDFTFVRTAAARVQGFLTENGCEPETSADCELAVVEGCNNAIKHNWPDGRRAPISVEVRLGRREIELRITDHGPGFVWPESVQLPEPEDETGRGLYLIRRLMDSARYVRGTHENTLVLRRRRLPGHTAGHAGPSNRSAGGQFT
jgi:anti-sigma regulatory factor (Ser/Thr protein kinase)